MNAMIDAMVISGNVASVLLLSGFGLITICLAVWFMRFREKSPQEQPVSFYNRRFNNLADRYQLNSKEIDVLRDFARMERQRRKNYYEYLNRNARYF